MKRIAASDARRNWFRILDDVISGEVVVVERKGRSVILRCEDLEAEAETANGPDYRPLLQAPDLDQADRWGWEWGGPDRDLTSVTVNDS